MLCNKYEKEIINIILSYLGWRNVVSLITLLPDAEYTKENLAIKLKDLCTKENIPHVSIMRSLRILLTGQKVIFYYVRYYQIYISF